MQLWSWLKFSGVIILWGILGQIFLIVVGKLVAPVYQISLDGTLRSAAPRVQVILIAMTIYSLLTIAALAWWGRRESAEELE